MTIQELDQEVLSRIHGMEDEKRKEAYDFVVDFLDKYHLDNIEDFIHMDIWEFIKCSLYINCKEKDMNKYREVIDGCKDLFDSLKIGNIEKLLTLVNMFAKENNIDELIGIIQSKYSFKFVQWKSKFESMNINFVPFLEEVKINGETFLKEVAFYLTYRNVLDFLNNKVFEVHADVTSERQMKDLRARVLTSALEDFFNVPAILDKMNSVKTFKEECERVDRNNQREKTGLLNARSALDKELDKKQIIMYRDIIKGIKSPKIKYLFLHYIKEHNEEYLNELIEELNRLRQDSKVSIQALLNDYGISKDSYDYESLPAFSKEELETILKVLSKLNITNEEKIRIIKSTSINRINSLKDYLDRDLLSIEYVSNNTYILDEDRKELDYFKDNMVLLKSLGISLQLFSNSIGILMNDSSRIRQNIDVLNTYNLLIPLSKTEDFNFLLNEDLERVIDKYLELGFEEYLESDLNLLNKTELERIEVLKVIGIPITSREELERYLDRDFFIPKEEIENYLPNDVRYVEEPKEVISKEQLEEYKSTNRVYDFNGIKISIEKVNRLVNIGNSLYQAIISNTNLQEDELLRIVKIIRTEKPKELKRTDES